ncbi:MAG: anti-phage BREX system Lon protease BrxL, partial [Bacteroidota bacterium]
MALRDKITETFEGKVVRKDLTKEIKGNAVVPSYVLEYLLGQHCATFDEDIIKEGVENVKIIIRDHFVRRDEAEIIKSTVRDKGQHKIIDKVAAKLNEKKDIYEASFANLGIKNVPISNSIVKKHKKLLTSGVWCIITLGYEAGDDNESPWVIHS